MVPPKLIQVLCGHWQHHLAFQRSCNCVLDLTYGWLQACYRDGVITKSRKALTRKVRDELLVLCVLAPLMHTQLDRCMASQVIASDVTIWKGAVVTASLHSPSQAGFLWRASDHVIYPMRFVPAVLRSDLDPLVSPMYSLQFPFVEDQALTSFVETTQFRAGPKFRFHAEAHINRQELAA
eukprot:5696858-Amphidinium_carterae.1